MQAAEAATDAQEGETKRSWTLSYSVNSQGTSPLQTPVKTEDAEVEPIEGLPAAITADQSAVEEEPVPQIEVTDVPPEIEVTEAVTEVEAAELVVHVEATEPEVEEPKVEEPQVKEPVVQAPEVNEPEVNEPEVNEPEVNEPAVNEPEVVESAKVELTEAVAETTEAVEVSISCISFDAQRLNRMCRLRHPRCRRMRMRLLRNDLGRPLTLSHVKAQRLLCRRKSSKWRLLRCLPPRWWKWLPLRPPRS